MKQERLSPSQMEQNAQQSNSGQLGLNNYKSTSPEAYEREIEYIDGTPYNLTKLGKNDRWRIAIGNNLVSPKTFKKKWMAKVYIKSKPLSLIVTTSVIISKMEKA